MQVNVFIAHAADKPLELLVMPYAPSITIPNHLQGRSWRHMATTTADDKRLGASTREIEAKIAAGGYALVKSRI